MKRIYSLAVAAIATLSAISCTQELNKVEVSDDASVFTAYADGADVTKTVKVGNESHWQSGDRIWVLNGKEGDYGWKKAYTTSDSNTSKAEFVEEDNSYPLEGDKYFAVYPASTADNATWEGGDLMGVELTPNQAAVAGSFDPAAHIAVAQSENQTLSFKNAVSLVKFQVKNEGVKSVTIYSFGGEKITGKCNVSAEGTVSPWTGENEANGWVELSAGEGTFEVGKDYYISVFPSVLADGFGLEFSFGGQKILVKSYETEVNFKRNGVINLGELEYVEPTVEEFVPQEGWAYVKPNANWKEANARFAAYFFNNGETWVDLTLVPGQTDIYGCQVPAGYVDIIFCRMNPAEPANNWNNKWNQTSDLKLTDGCLYTVEEGSWDNGNGVWSGAPAVATPDQPEPENPEPENPTPEQPEPENPTPEQPEPEQPAVDTKLYVKPNKNWKEANARFAAYFFENGKSEVWVSMTLVAGETDIYACEPPTGYTNVIFCRMNPGATANNWNNKWNQTADLKVPTDGTNLYTVKENTWDKGGGTWSKK